MSIHLNSANTVFCLVGLTVIVTLERPINTVLEQKLATLHGEPRESNGARRYINPRLPRKVKYLPAVYLRLL